MLLEKFFLGIPDEESKKIVITNTYDIYSSFIDAIKDFSKKPYSLQLTLDSSNGINIVPDVEVLLKENNEGESITMEMYQLIGSMKVIDSILNSEDTKIRFEANSSIK